jgi:EmrB/QacA subfamily drug resistance transporter
MGTPGTGQGTAKADTTRQLSSRAQLTATIGALLALALASIDISIVSTAMPRIAADLHGLGLYSLVGAGYAVAAAVVVPIAGKLGDLFGRKPFLLTGIFGLVVLSLLCGLAQNMGELVAARVIAGVFAGILMANVFTLAADIFTAEKRTQVQGIFFSVAGLSMVVGPPLGGVITDSWSWRWVFYLTVPIGLVSFVAVLTAVPRVASKASVSDIDFVGAVTLICGLVPILIALTLAGQDHPWASPAVLVPLLIGAVMLVAFYFVETRYTKNPIVPFRLFRSNQVSIMVVVAFASAFAMMGTVYYVPLLYQGVLGVSAAFSGSLVIPLTAALFIVPPFASKALLAIKRYRFLGVFAFAAMIAGFVLLISVDPGGSKVVPLVAMVLIGVGIAIAFPMATAVTQSSVSMTEVGVATSQIQFWRMIAGPVCLAVLGSILSSRVSASVIASGGVHLNAAGAATLAHALHLAFFASLVVAAVGVVACLVLREVPVIDMKAMMKQRTAGAGAKAASAARG